MPLDFAMHRSSLDTYGPKHHPCPCSCLGWAHTLPNVPMCAPFTFQAHTSESKPEVMKRSSSSAIVQMLDTPPVWARHVATGSMQFCGGLRSQPWLLQKATRALVLHVFTMPCESAVSMYRLVLLRAMASTDSSEMCPAYILSHHAVAIEIKMCKLDWPQHKATGAECSFFGAPRGRSTPTKSILIACLSESVHAQR
jgi:hypothetical protein